jgi:hypothetical protein
MRSCLKLLCQAIQQQQVWSSAFEALGAVVPMMALEASSKALNAFGGFVKAWLADVGPFLREMKIFHYCAALHPDSESHPLHDKAIEAVSLWTTELQTGRDTTLPREGPLHDSLAQQKDVLVDLPITFLAIHKYCEEYEGPDYAGRAAALHQAHLVAMKVAFFASRSSQF